MDSKATEAKHHVVIYQSSSEMRHPFENALSNLGIHILWMTNYEELLALPNPEELAAVVIDLDMLNTPMEMHFQSLRAHFSNTDLIAISSSDSSQLALQCVRAGFTDFLLKPVSPEELAWSIRKCFQQKEALERLTPASSTGALVRAVTQISSSTTPALVQLYTLDYLKQFLQAKGAVWIVLDEHGQQSKEILCSVPKKIQAEEFLQEFPFEKFDPKSNKPIVFDGNTTAERKLLLFCQDQPKGVIFFWGIKKKLSKSIISHAELLLEHTELSLINIQKMDELKQRTFVDDLTGLYNARFLKYAINNAIQRCKKPENKFTVLFIDVDRFKSINDMNGHMVGSDFLIAISKTIKHAVRSIDPVFRYGGDEFVVLLNDTDTQGAYEIAERIRKNIERRLFVIHDKRLKTTVSIGLATYPDHTSDRESLLKLADEAMYSAKRAERNAVHLAVPSSDKLPNAA